MRVSVRHVAAIVAIWALLGPAFIDGCLISCHASDSSSTPIPHCHGKAPESGVSLSHDRLACHHDHTLAALENVQPRRPVSSIGALHAEISNLPRAAFACAHVVRAPVSPPESPGIDSAAFVLPLRI